MADPLEKKIFELYTYQDYGSWNSEVRYELIDGVPYMMAAPSLQHQIILNTLNIQFFSWFNDKPCQIFIAPINVRLFPKADNTDDTVVQPDLLAVCDKSKLSDGKSCRGAPDLVLEILSPSSKQLDLHIKKDRYLKAGVKEYWIIDGDHNQVQVNYQEENEEVYRFQLGEETASSRLFRGLVINLTEVWNTIA